MNKKYFLSFIFLFLTVILNATQQVNDKIIYKGNKTELEIEWSYPSPLQVYYLINKTKKYPFQSISTGNYRGHIATWEIKSGKLFLKKINCGSKIYPLKNIFPDALNEDGSVFVDWFSGYLMIQIEPIKKSFDSPYSNEQFYALDHSIYLLLNMREGVVISEHKYRNDEYWKIVSKILSYKNLEEKDKEVIENYLGYINRFHKETNATKGEKKFYIEEDFNIFLIRYFTHEVLIPLTDYCIIKGSTIDFSQSGAFIESDLIIDEKCNILLFEMGASNVPDGPWRDYSSGAVQIVIQLKKLLPQKLNLNKELKFINNFARYQSPQKVTGKIELLKLDDKFAIFTGEIVFTSENPKTVQRICLENSKIPILKIKEYLGKHKNDFGENFKYSVEEKYQDILENTKKYKN